MSRSRRILLLTLTGLAAALFLVIFVNRPMPAAGLWPSLPYQSEDEWIVSQTARAVVDLAQFAQASAPASLDDLTISRIATSGFPPRLTFRVGKRDAAIDLKTYVWDPDAYVPLARSVGARETGSTGVANNEVVTALLDFTSQAFQAQNDVVSAALQADFRNPANHEAAAFLLAVLALREAAGQFSDSRLVLCRATAHLAMARAMRGPSTQPSMAGQLADVTLQVVAGRTGPAVMLMDALDRADVAAPAQAWIRALRRRATLDWRVPIADGALFLERLEYMRTLARMLTENASLEYLETHHPEPVPDWGWRTLDFPITVANGHVFVADTLERTRSEAARFLNGPRDGTAPPTAAAALSREPQISSLDRTASGTIRVIDEGTWRAFYQRHLANIASSGSDFYHRLLGSKQAGAEFDLAMDELLDGEPALALVQRLRVRRDERGATESEKAAAIAQYGATMARVVPLLRERPETIPYMVWRTMVTQVPRDATPIDALRSEQWFRTIYPTGTAFEERRMNIQRFIPEDFTAHADALHELAPWNPLITINWSLIRCRSGCTPEQERANYALIEGYSLAAMKKFAYMDADPVASLRRVCDVSRDDCGLLADWFVSRDRFPEAAKAYEQYILQGRDRVAVSNSVEWLVRYYQGSKRDADARRVAELAADVGSGRGLRALAGFHDRRREYHRAEELYRQIYDRYDNGTALLAFFLRRADAAGTAAITAPEYAVLLKRYFGGELEPVSSGTLSATPVRGLYVKSTTWWTEKAGVLKGDIVVAVDGVRVWTLDQSAVLYDRSFDAPLRYVVWRGGGYRDIKGPFRQHYYGVDVEPYVNRSK